MGKPRIPAANARFDAWAEWLGESLAKIGDRVGCDPSWVHVLRKGRPKKMPDGSTEQHWPAPNLPVAVRIEQASSDWPEGPIRIDEWHPEDGGRVRRGRAA